MKLEIRILTGALFEDGTPEAGKVWEEEISTREELDRALDEIPEGAAAELLADGEEMSPADIMARLD